jgi:hypothetical protein
MGVAVIVFMLLCFCVCVGKILHRILIMKANKMHYFSNLFDKVLYFFRTGPLSIIRSLNTV